MAYDMNSYIENPKDSTRKKLFKLINKFRKVTGHRLYYNALVIKAV